MTKITNFKELQLALLGEPVGKQEQIGRVPLDIGQGITVKKWEARRTRDRKHYDFAGTRITYEGKGYIIRGNAPHHMYIQKGVGGLEERIEIGNEDLSPYYLGSK